MTRKIGFIFLFSNQLQLKPYSPENKEWYEKKILLHSIGLVNLIFKTGEELIKTSIIKEIESKKHISSIILNEFNLKKSYILDFNPIPKKLVKSKEKNLTIYVVVLDNKFENKILNLLKESLNAKIFIDRILLSFKLKSIDTDSPDIFTAIKNYSKNKKLYSREIQLSDLNQSNYKITLNNVIEGLCGIEELREETKCYI